MLKLKFVPIVFLACCITGCNSQTSTTDAGHDSPDSIAAPTVLVKEDSVSYSSGPVNFKSFVAFKQDNHKKPIVLVVPEWWGVNDYIKSRVRQLAELGYLAFAVDMYGDGKNVITPVEAEKFAVPFYKNPVMAQAHFNAAMTKAKNYPDADTSKIAAIGYCFGGSMVLNMARLGEPLKGVVSFHGDLNNYGLLPTKGASTPAVLVLHWYRRVSLKDLKKKWTRRMLTINLLSIRVPGTLSLIPPRQVLAKNIKLTLLITKQRINRPGKK